jgi:hypothetical protein
MKGVTMIKDSIADASRPNPGRIYDYILGGGHNFEVDRIAAEKLMEMKPWVHKYARLQRWSLRNIAEELSRKRGFDVIIDFASGLPTNDHIHHRVPPETTVIYSDIDSVTVEYAQDILKDTPNAWAFESDAGNPDKLLSDPKVQTILNDRRKVAFVYWGVSVFLSDDAIRNAARTLYDWAAPGSCLAFQSQTLDRTHPSVIKTAEIYKKLGTESYARLPEEHLPLLEPWQIEGDEFVPLYKWHGFSEEEFMDEENSVYGPSCGGHGAYFTKK